MDNKIAITKELIIAASGAKQSDVELLLPYLKPAMEKAGINTPARVLSFLAQVGTESGGLSRTEEWADGSAYEGRCVGLGNCNPGDGRKFKGRGLIQLTGRANYAAFSKYAGIDAVNNPTLIAADWTRNATAAQLKNSVLASTWFWSNRKLNDLADQLDVNNPLSANNLATFRQIGKKINGINPPNGDADRNQRMASGLNFYLANKKELAKKLSPVLIGAIGVGAVGLVILGIYLYKRYT